jgi:hypothetical protein
LSLPDSEEETMQVKERLPDKARIRQLNDAFRSTFVGGVVVMTAGVDALPTEFKASVLQAVREFRDFDEGNDPHHEHDFGAFELNNQRFFFKLDYYDTSMEFGSPDPSDATETTRTLTVMLAEEY